MAEKKAKSGKTGKPAKNAKPDDEGGGDDAPKKKGGKKSVPAASTEGPTANLRSRMRALAEQKKQDEPQFKKQRVGVVYDEEMLLHRHSK